MLGYISSTRKKSCYACVRSKRRCDLGYPYCKRCFVKGIDCKYPNATATPREASSKTSGVVPGDVVLRQTTPDFAASGPTEITFIDASADIDPFLFTSSESSSSPEDVPQDLYFQEDWNVEIPPLLPPSTWRPEIVIPSFLNRDQISFVIASLLGFVPAMAYAGSTIFMHKNLYVSHEPPAYQDCVALSALYMTKTARNRGILANAIGSKISGLISESATWSLTQHLAAVQALIVYQAIRLFDPDLGLQETAEKDNALLELWSAHLWKRSFNEPQSFATPYASYVFQESLRRTIMMSVFTRCGWSILTKGGLAEQVPVLARLPFTKDLGAWKCEPEDWSARNAGSRKEEDGLVNYAEWSVQWSAKRELGELDAFGKLLMGACWGKDDPRLLVGPIG